MPVGDTKEKYTEIFCNFINIYICRLVKTLNCSNIQLECLYKMKKSGGAIITKHLPPP